MIRPQVINILVQVSKENYFKPIQALNNIFLYKNQSLPQVFILSQKLADDFLLGLPQEQKTIKKIIGMDHSTNPPKDIVKEEKITVYKTINQEQKKEIANKVVNENQDLFLQTLGKDIDDLFGIDIKTIGSKYLFSLWSAAEKTLHRRKQRRNRFKKERLQKQFVETLNHGGFYLVKLTRAKLKKVCTVKYTLETKTVNYYEAYRYYRDYRNGYVFRSLGQTCPGQGKGHGCGAKVMIGNKRKTMSEEWCCRRTWYTSYSPRTAHFQNYSCKNASYWTVQMDLKKCWHWQDAHHDYYNLCEIKSGKYFPIKRIKENGSTRATDVNYNKNRTKILPLDLYHAFNDIYPHGKIYDSQTAGRHGLQKTNCPNLCKTKQVLVATDAKTGKKTYKQVKTNSFIERKEQSMSHRPCWQRQPNPWP